MLAEETSKKEPTFSDMSSEDGRLADEDDDVDFNIVESAYLADEHNDEEDVWCMGFENPIENTKVEPQFSLSFISDDDSAGKILPEIVSWEEFQQKMMDYKRFAFIFE